MRPRLGPNPAPLWTVVAAAPADVPPILSPCRDSGLPALSKTRGTSLRTQAHRGPHEPRPSHPTVRPSLRSISHSCTIPDRRTVCSARRFCESHMVSRSMTIIPMDTRTSHSWNARFISSRKCASLASTSSRRSLSSGTCLRGSPGRISSARRRRGGLCSTRCLIGRGRLLLLIWYVPRFPSTSIHGHQLMDRN